MFGKKDKQVDQELFTIYDSKSKSYGDIVAETNKDVLMRGILNMFRDQKQVNNPYLKNAEDFAIFKIGSYDKGTGQIETHNAEHVVNMHDLRSLAGPLPPNPEIPV